MASKGDPNTTNKDVEIIPIEVNPVKSWKGLLWDTFDLPKDERKLLFKVDAFVLTFASVSNEFTVLEKKRDIFLTKSISLVTFSRTWIKPM